MTLKLQKIIAAIFVSTLITLTANATLAGSNQYGPQYASIPLSKAEPAGRAATGDAAWTIEVVPGQGMLSVPPSSPNVSVTFRWIGQASKAGNGEIDPRYLRPLDDVILSGVDSALWRGLPAGDHVEPGRWYATHEERQLFVGTDISVNNGSLIAGLNMPPFIFGVGVGISF